MSQIQDDLFKLIEAKTGVFPQMEDTLDVLKIDSLGMAELTVEIEKVFSIHIDEDVLDVQNVEGLISYIQRKMPKREG